MFCSHKGEQNASKSLGKEVILSWKSLENHCQISVQTLYAAVISTLIIVSCSDFRTNTRFFVSCVLCQRAQCEQVIKIHVGANSARLLEAAEQMEVRKVYHDGSLREICLDDIANYKDSGAAGSYFVFFYYCRNYYHYY